MTSAQHTLLGLIGGAILLAAMGGCRPQPVEGGTAGSLVIQGSPVSEIQISVHQNTGGSWTKIGFGDTRADGSFELVKLGAEGPLVLEPGEYRFTLESIGVPLFLPPIYTSPQATPLVVQYPTSDGSIPLVIGSPAPGR